MAEKYVRFLTQYAVPKGNDFAGDTASKALRLIQLYNFSWNLSRQKNGF